MKRFKYFVALLLSGILLLSSCAPSGDGNDPDDDNSTIEALPFPTDAFTREARQSVIGSIVQNGDGNVYVRGTALSPVTRSVVARNNSFKHLVTMEHNFGYSCYVSGYIGNSLYIIQDHGSLGWNKKGIGHKDGSVLLEYGEGGYFSISSFSENKIIVGNPTDPAVESLWQMSDSYLFGYMVYDPETRTLSPMYEENNLRFYTAGYFINGVAQVSVKTGDDIRFGIIDEEGNFVVEPTYGMMADERIDGALIVAEEAEGVTSLFYNGDNCGRNIAYDSTLMTNVQKSRRYECASQTVGIIDAKTGESILPCSYSYIERVMDSTYFVIDNEGKRFLFDAKENTFTEVEGIYSYFNNEWMLYTADIIEKPEDSGESEDTGEIEYPGVTIPGTGVKPEENMNKPAEVYLADKELKLYEATGIDVGAGIDAPSYTAKNCINTNMISAHLNEKAGQPLPSIGGLNGIFTLVYDSEKGTSILTVLATGEVIYDVNSATAPFNEAFLYTKENSLFRYDLKTGENTKIDTGYGDFTEGYEGWMGITKHYTSIHPLDEGVYILRYNAVMDLGSTYFMVIINDLGEVLYDAAINSVENLTKNYLGEYDAALYELAGRTDIKDNYFLTRDDGSHFLLQLVRGEAENNEGEGDEDRRYTRKICNTNDIAYLSPFILDFTDGSEISITAYGEEISSDNYVYNSETKSLKLKTWIIDPTIQHKMRIDGFVDFIVTSGDESLTVRIEVSEFAFRF